ncbi:MAG TPA: efflux transporter outer membrane subunit [Methylophilaceae bacterium]
MLRAVNLMASGRPCRHLLLAGMLLIAGCHSMAPEYERPAAPVAEQYPLSGETAGLPAAGLGWRQYFTDPALQALIAQALEHNRDMRAAILRVEEAQTAYGIARAGRYPHVDAIGSYNRSRTPADLSMTGRPIIAEDYLVGIGISNWEIDFWGRVRSLKDAALESYLATAEARRALQIALIARVADGYLTLRELDERLAIARKTIESRAETLRIFRRRHEVGATSRLDLTQAETLLSQAQSLEYQLQQTRSAQYNALTLLVGQSFELAPASQSLDRITLPEIAAGLPSDLLLARPDIMAAEHRLKAANANIGAARAAFFPRISLTTTYGSASSELEGLFEAGSQAWKFSPSISLPIFDAGRNRANLNLAEVRRDLAVTEYEKTIQTAFREVADALAARKWLEQQVRSQQQTRDALSERSRLVRLRYDSGATSYFEVLDAERELLAAEQQLTQTRRALLSSRIGLYAALGGGTQAGVEPISQ